jgi:hypothetical protein
MKFWETVIPDFLPLLSAIIQAVVAVIMCLSIKEIRKDRKREFLEKRLEEFYIPLINLFGHGSLRRSGLEKEVEEIIVSKRHLCGKRVAGVLPQHFTGRAKFEPEEFYFYFASEDEVKRWEKVADTVWDEYIEVLEEYYNIIGVKNYTLPEKPEWMFKVGETGRIF